MDDLPRSKYKFVFIFFIVLSFSALSDDLYKITYEANYYSPDSTDVLTIFSAKINKSEVNLIWKIYSPDKLSYFQIEKSISNNKSFIPVKKNINKSDYIEKSESNTDFIYSYTDNPHFNGVYYYRLNCYDLNNKILWQSDAIKVGISDIKDFTLEQNQPNPFNPSTAISYELLKDTYVKLKVFDLIGKEIATLVDKMQSAGRYSVEFNAANYPNITSGIYFYKLETSTSSDVKKMIISK